MHENEYQLIRRDSLRCVMVWHPLTPVSTFLGDALEHFEMQSLSEGEYFVTHDGAMADDPFYHIVVDANGNCKHTWYEEWVGEDWGI